MKTKVCLTVKHLTCNCCGGDAPALKQWYNRDTGYGMCGKCIANIRAGKIGSVMSEEEIRECYGVEGIHWLPFEEAA